MAAALVPAADFLVSVRISDDARQYGEDHQEWAAPARPVWPEALASYLIKWDALFH
jgi:hypothetical protein